MDAEENTNHDGLPATVPFLLDESGPVSGCTIGSGQESHRRSPARSILKKNDSTVCLPGNKKVRFVDGMYGGKERKENDDTITEYNKNNDPDKNITRTQEEENSAKERETRIVTPTKKFFQCNLFGKVTGKKPLFFVKEYKKKWHSRQRPLTGVQNALTPSKEIEDELSSWC